MKVINGVEIGLKTFSCVVCLPRKKAHIWGGHVHSDERFKKTVVAGFCNSICASSESGKCSIHNGGCFGVVRLRGFKNHHQIPRRGKK